MVKDGIIEMDVGLQAKSKSEIDEYLQKTEVIKDNLQEIRKAVGDEIPEDAVLPKVVGGKETEKKTDKDTKGKKNDKKSEEEKKTELTEMLESLNEGDVNKLRSFLKNPENFLEMGIEKLFTALGPNSAVILSLVGAITAAPILYIEILKALSVKGGPFNRDWRRVIQKEVDAGLTREQVKLREVGASQTIISQTRGFVPNNPMATYNSLYHVNESRLARIGLDDKAAGVTYGK